MTTTIIVECRSFIIDSKQRGIKYKSELNQRSDSLLSVVDPTLFIIH